MATNIVNILVIVLIVILVIWVWQNFCGSSVEGLQYINAIPEDDLTEISDVAYQIGERTGDEDVKELSKEMFKLKDLGDKKTYEKRVQRLLEHLKVCSKRALDADAKHSLKVLRACLAESIACPLKEHFTFGRHLMLQRMRSLNPQRSWYFYRSLLR
jgi:hypothetical protein